jgi:nucleotide-binding universal stress UspA family protein
MKRILVALDASPRAPLVLADAARLAGLTGAKLILFRAIGVPPEMPREIFANTDVRLEDMLRSNAHHALQDLARAISPELVEQLTTELATPWDGIVRAAKAHDVDLIVLGAHGYGTLDRMLGTTAAKVSNHADRNVLIVRTPL